MTANRSPANDETRTPRAVRLWIDGVGCWLVWLPEQFIIGGPQRRGSAVAQVADLALFADLRSRHAMIERQGEHYSLTPFAAVAINGKPVMEGASPANQAAPLRHGLKSGDEVTLGGEVRLQFTIPTPLSNTARLVCTSGHRPEERIDGIILLEQFCQLGPQPDHHIVCPQAESPLILFRKRQELWCRSPQEWTLNGHPVTGSAALQNGAIVTTETISFRFEFLAEY